MEQQARHPHSGVQRSPAFSLRSLPLLHSWIKEERQTRFDRNQLLRTGVIALLVLLPLLGLQLQRKVQLVLGQEAANRNDTLALMEATLSSTNRVARDWGHWDDAYRFALGLNPGYVRNNLGTGALFDGGAIMVMLRPDGSRLLAYAAPGFRLASYDALIRCLRDNRGRLPSLRSTLRLACLADNGALYLGTATQVSDNTATAPSAGTLVMYDPLLLPDYTGQIRKQLELLRRELVIKSADSLGFDQDLELIQPPIHSNDGALLAIRRPALLPVLGQALLEELPLLAAIPLLSISLRALTMLQRRRQRISDCQAERAANRRIRRTCTKLETLLTSLIPTDTRPWRPTDTLARLSQRDGRPQSTEPTLEASQHRSQLQDSHGSLASSERQLEKVSQKFEQFLHTLLGVKHHRITQAGAVLSQQDL